MDRSTKIAIWATIAVVGSWAATPFIVSRLVIPEGQGQFGDLFGSVNSLFSGLGFVGLIYAVLLQREDLNIQRQDLHQSASELMYQREQMARTTEAIERQARLTEQNIHLTVLTAQLAAAQQAVEGYERAEERGIRQIDGRSVHAEIGRSKSLRKELVTQLEEFQSRLLKENEGEKPRDT